VSCGSAEDPYQTFPRVQTSIEATFRGMAAVAPLFSHRLFWRLHHRGAPPPAYGIAYQIRLA